MSMPPLSPRVRRALALILVASLAAATGVVATRGGNDEVLALAGLDPVLLVDGKRADGLPGITSDRDRLVYRFTSPATRERFESEPERFAIQRGRDCTVMGSARANPSVFHVHEGRTYAFGSAACRETFLENPDHFIAAASERLKVGIVVYDGVELLDFSGPGEVFAATSRFDLYTVSASTEPVLSQGFVEVVPRHSFESSPMPDVLVVPGGDVERLTSDQRALAWVREAAESAEIVLSVCTGAFVLAEIGLLDGIEATTHARALDDLRARAPRSRIVDDTRYVDAGKIVTTAGVARGIDGALHVVARLLGGDVADAVSTYIEYPRTNPLAAAPSRQAVGRTHATAIGDGAAERTHDNAG